MAIYKVKEDGKAPQGLSAGDEVVTGGGTYRITGVNDDGTYKSEKVDANKTTYNYTGGYASAPKKSSNKQTSTYQAKGTHFDKTIEDIGGSDLDLLNTYKQNWADAKAAGDQTAMDAAHAAAEALRQKYNYSGGSDGSDFIQKPEEIFNIPSYTYDTQSRPSYESKYDNGIDELLNQILTRDDFSYNVENDPLYQQYKAMYLREGNRAMNDTLASAAANAGGMNSYAVTAAQQANNYHMAQLNDKIPELYQLAYGMYLDDIDNDVRNLGLLDQMDDKQYNRYRDTMGDWENDRDFAYNQYRDDMGDYFNNRDFQYGVERDAVADSNYEREWNYGLERDEVEDGRYDSATAYDQAMQWIQQGLMPDGALLEKAGITTQEAQAYINRVKAAEALGGGGSGGSGGSGGGSKSSSKGSSDDDSKKTGTSYDNDGYSTEQIKELQRHFGVPADGFWGPASKKAANGMSASQAMESIKVDSSNDIYGGAESDGFYDISRVARQLYNRGKSDDEIADYLADRVEDYSITREEAVRIAKNYGVDL